MRAPGIVLVAFAIAGCSRSTPQAQPAASGTTSTGKMSITSKSPEALEHFKKAEVFMVNSRVVEAAAESAEALKLDPDFALARAVHAQSTPGLEGLTELEAAAAGAAALPEAERTLIEGTLAARRNEPAKARAAYTKLTELAPADWRGHYLLGTLLLTSEEYSAAVPALRKAVELDSAAGGANNMLGYAALRQGDTEGAIKAFTEYAPRVATGAQPAGLARRSAARGRPIQGG